MRLPFLLIFPQVTVTVGERGYGTDFGDVEKA